MTEDKLDEAFVEGDKGLKSEELENLASENDEALMYKVIGMSNELVSQGRITEEKANEVQELARNDELTEAIDLLEDLVVEDAAEEGIDFSDEDIRNFADAFGDAIDELEESIKEFQEELQTLEDGISRGEMRQYLYGGKSSRTYDDVDDLFDAIDSVSAGGFSDRKIAKILSAYTSRLNISDVEDLISEMREKN